MADLQVMTAILNRPEVRGQARDHQTRLKVQALNPGYSLPEHRYLHDGKPGHNQSRHHRCEYALFAACEDQHRGYERTSSYANHQYERGNGIIAERRVL